MEKQYFSRKIKLSGTGRIDQLLRQEAKEDLSFLTRLSWKKLFKEGWILDENGKKLLPGDRVFEDILVVIKLPVPYLGLIASEESITPPLFISSNKKFMIFSKDSGIHSYPRLPWEKDCFSNRLAYFLEKESYISLKEFEALGPPPSLEGGLLQRLDQGTSGLISVALSPEEKERYRSYFSKKKMQKHYLALVYGRLEQDSCEISFKFSQITPSHVKVSSVQDPGGGKLATMKINVLDSSEHFSLLELVTKEGIRHQIRAALDFLGNPLLGDTLYCHMDTKKKQKFDQCLPSIPKVHQLHAWKIQLPKEEGGILVKREPPNVFLERISSLSLSFSA